MKTKKNQRYYDKKVVTCQQDDNTYEAAVKMRDADIGAIPVVNGDQLLASSQTVTLYSEALQKKPNSQGK
ncbi:CBS domain-containing protein [Bacillus sp. SL00103]